MSDLYQEIYGDNAPHHRVCRVAFTLNHSQPVLCTYIGDKPLFYLDNEDEHYLEEFEEDEYFYKADSKLMAQELAGLRAELAQIEDRQAAHYGLSSAQSYEEFSENIQSLWESADVLPHTKEEEASIQMLRETLSRSRTGAAYLDLAARHNVQIALSAQVDTAFYDRRVGKIFINAQQTPTDQALLLVRELRRHWQHREGALINPLTFLPEHAILIFRAQNVDLMVSIVRTAWELQLAGQSEIWERIENSPMADLGRAYAREAFLDFRTINNGVASAAVFEAWFLSERCRYYDKKIIQAMLADYQGYVFENTEASKSITAELIAKLGSVPFGKNYLAAHSATIMNDPIFTDVRDRSNANFLWFIKFERSFKETEQELHRGDNLSTHDIRHEVFTSKNQGKIHDTQHSAEIIQLFGTAGTRSNTNSSDADGKRALRTRPVRRKASKHSKKYGRNHNEHSAKIIDMRAWSSSR